MYKQDIVGWVTEQETTLDAMRFVHGRVDDVFTGYDMCPECGEKQDGVVFLYEDEHCAFLCKHCGRVWHQSPTYEAVKA